MEKKPAVVILCGGGPAPGMNTVVSSVAKAFLKSNYRVIGLHDGYQNLFASEQYIIDIDFDFADRIFSQGGSALRMSRHKPADADFNPAFFIKHNIKLLVTIGGDDTASTATRISQYLEKNNVKIQNIHVPKTIDNDLPLPEGISTFGYQSAKDEGVHIGKAVYEDARTSAQWFLMCAMGRSAGHLTFGIGSSSHYPMIVIPEMFNKTDITMDKIINLVVSSILKRKVLGVNYGVAIVSEGVFHILSDEEVKNTGIVFTYDAHGHPELGAVSKAHVFNILLQKKLKEIDLNVKSRPVELGYELRCVSPKAFDLMYCNLLGTGVKTLFDKGETGCIVSTDINGRVKALNLEDLKDPKTGKIPPRLVNIEGGKAQTIFNNCLHYITPEDYEAAKKFVKNPEEFDFKKILKW